METFLAIQNTYTQVQMALGKDTQLSEIISLDKTVASKECIIALDRLLSQNSVSLSDLSFIAVNQGPGPFTTLRVVISTVNGLSFARKIPLIGVNALQALAAQYDAPTKVILLNAFAGDMYYLIEKNGQQTIGAGKTASLLQLVEQKIPHDPILFLGNGVLLHHELITATFGNRAHLPTPFVEFPSLASIARHGFAQWQTKENVSYQLQPLYYKQAFIG